MRRAASLVVALAAAVAGLSGCGSSGKVDCDHYRFDPAKWVDPHGDHQKARRAEALLLARCGRLIGKTDEQVVELLGRATQGTRGQWVYDLESAQLMGDSGALEISFRHFRVTSVNAY